jgi:hypothetical protein
MPQFRLKPDQIHDLLSFLKTLELRRRSYAAEAAIHAGGRRFRRFKA